MKVIVSCAIENDIFSQFVLVNSLSRVKELTGVDTLIIHKYSESDYDVGSFITEAKAKMGIETFVCINANPSPLMMAVMRGVQGYIFKDEFYLEDEDELSELLNGLVPEESKELVAVNSSLGVVQQFVDLFIQRDKSIEAPIYLETVKNALIELSKVTQTQELTLDLMGASALTVFTTANKYMRELDNLRKEQAEKVGLLEEKLQNMPTRSSFSNSLSFFPTHTYTGSSKVLFIREYAPCRYLTSFVLAYLNHLHYELNRRPKLVFVIQKGASTAKKYDRWPVIDDANSGNLPLYEQEIVATNNPKKKTLQELLGQPNNDIVIVVDRLYNRDILTGRITKVCAVSGRSDLARFKEDGIKPQDTIFSVTNQPSQLFCIPVMSNFPAEEQSRYAFYNSGMSKAYALLDARLGL